MVLLGLIRKLLLVSILLIVVRLDEGEYCMIGDKWSVFQCRIHTFLLDVMKGCLSV